MERILISNLKAGNKVLIKGWVHRIRRLSKISFLILRDRSGLVQCVVDNNINELEGLRNESIVSIVGNVVECKNSIGNLEVQVENIGIIQKVNFELPIEINSNIMESNLETQLNNRVLSLRHKQINAIFKIQALISQGFGEFLVSNGFTEVFTPKIVKEGAEGGTELFKIKYFDENAYLAQSPQFYKQMMVGAGYERVFEIGHVYRAEEHNTSRHTTNLLA